MDYLIHLAILFSIYGILGISLNLVVGYAGLLSLAHAAFYGIGAYMTAILLIETGAGFFSAVVLGIAVTAVVSFLIGAVLSKFKNDYYVLASLGFNSITFAVFINWEKLTRGPLGIPKIPRPNLELGTMNYEFSSSLSFLILVSAFLIIIYLTSRFIVNSSFGRALKAIREDEEVIQIFGYNVLYFKLAIFVISAAMASIAGSFFASYITFIDPLSFTLMESVFILAIIILGGLANLRGSILGALSLVLLPEILRFVGFPADIAAQTRQVVYGAILILLMLYKPQGLVGEYKL